jgi:predicted outer membrane repeat protein
MKKEVTLGIICTLLVAAWAPAATVYNVPLDFPTIQAALDAAVDGDEVTVDDGTYIGTGNTNLVLRSAVYVHSTSGVATNCIIDGGHTARAFKFYTGQATKMDPNSATDATRNFVVDGFTIQNCRAPDTDPNISTGEQGYGGGIIIDAGYPVIQNCIFIRNTAAGGNGGGIYVRSSASSANTRPRIISCVFGQNGADYGGGIASYAPSDIINCLIVGNSASSDGTGMYMESGASNVALCTLAYNGGNGLATASSQTFANCIIWDYVNGTVAASYCLVYDSTVRGTNIL